MAAQSFRQWIDHQRERIDEVGQFAREAHTAALPSDWINRDACLADLSLRGAADRFVQWAHLAWDDYEKST